MSKPMRQYETTATTLVLKPAMPQRYLISPNVDLMMIGGLSIFIFAFATLLLEHNQPSSTLAWTVYYLSFFFNFPHFLVSYHILYNDFGKNVLKEPKFIWAGIIVPILLGAGMMAGLFSGKPSVLGYMANAMYFFVGWHYVKQIFGGIVVTNALAKFFYNSTERYALKANLFSLWAISYISQNVGERSFALEGVPYYSLNLPQYLQTIAYWAIGITFCGVLATHIMKYIREGKAPTLPAIFCFTSIYIWFIPAMHHPMYFHLIPFFHSLQYILFVVAFRRNKVISSLGGELTSPEHRKEFFTRFHGYLAFAVVTGSTFLWFLPKWLDSYHLVQPGLFGPTVMMFVFTVFINVHHYFIDNVIWRGNNPEMRKHLFGAQ